MAPMALGERFKREIPGLKLLVIEKCGHSSNIEQADQFNATVMEFLGGTNVPSKM